MVRPMTDLERAREALMKLSPIQAVTALVEAARREGAAEMRERAALVCERRAMTENIITNRTAHNLARRIRALPLTPEEPA